MISNRPVTGVPLSVVVPAFNEAENLAPLVSELFAVLEPRQEPFEIILVDDGSTDGTWDVLRTLLEWNTSQPQTSQASASYAGSLRILRHRSNFGQSAALVTCFAAAQGQWIATLDGDGQNDPADIPRLLHEAKTYLADCVIGVRVERRDSWTKKAFSRLGNAFRNWITGDRLADSGCGIRVVRAACLAELPVFDGVHRFLPTILRAQGWSVIERTVNHRPRLRGVSKYGIGNRFWRVTRDCFAMRWYLNRALPGKRLAPHWNRESPCEDHPKRQSSEAADAPCPTRRKERPQEEVSDAVQNATGK